MPSDAYLEAHGLCRDDYEDEFVAVWPCNQAAVGFFIDYCTTQWRVGPTGPTGLDRGVVLQDLRRLRLPQDEEDVLYAQVREIERVALRKIRELSEQGRD